MSTKVEWVRDDINEAAGKLIDAIYEKGEQDKRDEIDNPRKNPETTVYEIIVHSRLTPNGRRVYFAQVVSEIPFGIGTLWANGHSEGSSISNLRTHYARALFDSKLIKSWPACRDKAADVVFQVIERRDRE